MKIFQRDDFPIKLVNAYGSQGAEIAHLVSINSESSLVWAHLQPGGLLGMHEAASDQLFIVVKGSGIARGERIESQEIEEGSLVLWRKGQLHETIAGAQGLSAIIIESESIL